MVAITPEIAGIAALLIWNSLESRNLRATITGFRGDLAKFIASLNNRKEALK